jgi:dTDP-4-dehydrorhamnose 3,5-epimerase
LNILQFESTSIAGLYVVEGDLFRDNRGSFGRMFCRREFAARGLASEIVQCNVSHSPSRGILRGFHIQAAPHQEAKLVRCVAGRIFDVALDLRRASPTFGRFFAVELSGRDERMVYIPEGCAHAYQTLEDDTIIVYQVSAFHELAAERGVKWNDPDVAVPWPLTENIILSERDQNLPSLADYRLDE